MQTPEGLLSVVAEKSGDSIHIHADEVGLARLAHVVAYLRSQLKAGECGYDRLFSEAWGGRDLTQSMSTQDRAAGAIQVHLIKISAWTPEWKEKNGL